MKNWMLWLIVGVISIVGGLVALINPLAATVAAERLIGWIFIIVGVLQVISAFREQGRGASLWAGLIGVLALLAGVSLLSNPFSGIISLTLVLSILIAAAGVSKLITAYKIRRARYFPLVLISGLVSIVLAILIFTNFQEAATVLLGVMLAIELISNGVSLIALSLFRKPAA